MPSGFVRDFANNGSFFGKRDSELSTYPSYTLNIPSGLLERYFIVPSGLLESILNLSSFLLPSCYLLPTFFLPSFYPLFCIYQKNIFHTIYHKFITFNFQVQRLSTANCELQYTLRRTFLEATLLLSPYYPLAIPTFNIRIDLDAFDLQKTSWNWHKLFQVSSFNFFIFEPRNQDTDISGGNPSDISSLHKFSD